MPPLCHPLDSRPSLIGLNNTKWRVLRFCFGADQMKSLCRLYLYWNTKLKPSWCSDRCVFISISLTLPSCMHYTSTPPAAACRWQTFLLLSLVRLRFLSGYLGCFFMCPSIFPFQHLLFLNLQLLFPQRAQRDERSRTEAGREIRGEMEERGEREGGRDEEETWSWKDGNGKNKACECLEWRPVAQRCLADCQVERINRGRERTEGEKEGRVWYCSRPRFPLRPPAGWSENREECLTEWLLLDCVIKAALF